MRRWSASVLTPTGDSAQLRFDSIDNSIREFFRHAEEFAAHKQSLCSDAGADDCDLAPPQVLLDAIQAIGTPAPLDQTCDAPTGGETESCAKHQIPQVVRDIYHKVAHGIVRRGKQYLVRQFCHALYLPARNLLSLSLL